MTGITWEIFKEERRVRLFDSDRAMLTLFRFKKSTHDAKNCGMCSFAAEKTVCDRVDCDGGYYVARDTASKSRTHPDAMHKARPRQ